MYSLMFCATELSHYVALVLINITWLSTHSPNNNSPLLFGSNFFISDSRCSNTVGQCCKYNCIKIHPKSNKRSTIKPVFGIFQHYILKKTPSHPHEAIKKKKKSQTWFTGEEALKDSERMAALSLTGDITLRANGWTSKLFFSLQMKTNRAVLRKAWTYPCNYSPHSLACSLEGKYRCSCQRCYNMSLDHRCPEFRIHSHLWSKKKVVSEYGKFTFWNGLVLSVNINVDCEGENSQGTWKSR